VDPQLGDTFSDGAHVPRITAGESFDPDKDTSSRLRVFQAVEPLGEDLGLPNLDHSKSVATRLQRVNEAGERVVKQERQRGFG
jgi:hypothetical protein